MNIKAVIEALAAAHHELTTLHGLWATDDIDSYDHALREGCDPHGAWHVFYDPIWQIDVSELLKRIDVAQEALAGLVAKQLERDPKRDEALKKLAADVLAQAGCIYDRTLYTGACLWCRELPDQHLSWCPTSIAHEALKEE